MNSPSAEPGSVYGVSDVHPQPRPVEHGSGPVLSGPDDPAAGAGPGSGEPGRDRDRNRLHGSVQRQRDCQDEGEDQEALRHCA